MPNKGKLFLIPNLIAPESGHGVLPTQVTKLLPGIRFFLAEDIRTARRYLSSLKIHDSVETLQFSVLDKDTRAEEMEGFFAPVFAGHDIGVISESGCPGVADPGALAVRFAHDHHVRVIPLVGPSSLLLALMASGLNGQRFAFHGYLPIDAREAGRVIRDLEKESRINAQTQIFIETPYRNNNLLQHLIRNLDNDTSLCIAIDLTGESELVFTQPIRKWRKDSPLLTKKPAVFLFLAG